MQIIASAILALALHELAHVAAARITGVRVYQVGMSRKGPFIRRDPGTTGQNLMITLAGPGINLLLALAMCRLNPSFALSNFVLGVSNLLPFISSDGARALTLLATMRQQAASVDLTSRGHSEVETAVVIRGKRRGQAA